MRYIKVLRDNFSAVDLREEPCHNGLSEKGKRGGKGKERTKRRAAEEQGDFASGSAQNALSAASSPQTSLLSNASVGALQVCFVAAPLPKKFCDTFWEPCSVC